MPSERSDRCQAMNIEDEKSKVRDIKIAKNESRMQATGEARVSLWAIAAAVIIGLVAFGWVFLHR
jgi:uncharacterized protein HemX